MKNSALLIILFSLTLAGRVTSSSIIKTPELLTSNLKLTMQNTNYTTSFWVNKSPKEVFEAINNVSGWWSEDVEGNTTALNGEFLYYYKDVHISKMRIIKFVPDKKIVWLVLENEFNFIKDKTEWKGDKIIFELTEKDGGTELKFTQEGLTPENECYNVCQDAWTGYIHGSLKDLIVTGKGKPNGKEGGLNQELIDKWNLPKK